MKTIAITIDKANLAKVESIASEEGKSKSEVIREAVSYYTKRKEEIREAEREAQIFRRHRKKLELQAKALVKEQAKG